MGNPTGATPSRVPAWSALRHRDFRLMWVGLFVSAVGTWMQIVATALFVLHLTHGSSLALGTVSLAQALSFFLFTPLGGAAADTVDRRRLLLATQSFLALLSVVLGVLALFGLVRLWMIVVAAFCGGAALSFDQPARGALIPSLVPPADLMNAISLQSMVFTGASTFGPALAGLAYAAIGYAGNCFLNAASYLAVLAPLLSLDASKLRAAPKAKSPGGPAGLLAHLGELRGPLRDGVLAWVISGYGALLFLGPSAAVMLPIFGVRILHLSAAQMGFLFSAAGLGSIVGSLAVGALGDFPYKARLFLVALLVWSAALAVFAASTHTWLSAAALLVLGAAQNAVGVTAVTLMQTRVVPQMRGRIMSLNTLLVMGARPLGDFPAGALIGAIGAPLTAGLCAALTGLYGIFLAVSRPRLRNS